VALFKISAASVISTMKVERPPAKSSEVWSRHESGSSFQNTPHSLSHGDGQILRYVCKQAVMILMRMGNNNPKKALGWASDPGYQG